MCTFIKALARNCSNHIKTPHFQIMSANLTVYHPNISTHAYPRTPLRPLVVPLSRHHHDCPYWNEELQRLLYEEKWLKRKFY